MKKLFAALAVGIIAAIVFAACSSLPTIQQQFETACPIVNGDLQVIGTSPLVSAANQQVIMQKVLPANQAICAAGAALNVTNLKAFHDSLLPVAIGIVQATPTLPDQTLILLALNTFGPLVQQMVDQIITAATPAAASASAAASTPLAGAPLQ